MAVVKSIVAAETAAVVVAAVIVEGIEPEGGSLQITQTRPEAETPGSSTSAR